MLNYLKNNVKVLVFLVVLIVLSGPAFSILLTGLEGLLNKDLGDWLGFYGTISGIVISLLVIHFQLSIDEAKNLARHRPEFALEYSYQLIKPGSPVYYDDRKWFRLMKSQNSKQFVEHNSFYQHYKEDDKMDKALAVEILNNQAVFNLHIAFDNQSSCEIIPRLEANQRIYIISEEHLEAIHNHLNGRKNSFKHVPSQITLYYTTLAGEKLSRVYTINNKGGCLLSKEMVNVSYPELSNSKQSSDYFIF